MKKKGAFYAGIDTLLELRKELIEQIMSFKELLNREDFTAMPYTNVKGYHNKTIAYSLYHTTGNELVKQEISIFSSKLNLDELYQYISDVDVSTTQLLKELSYEDLKKMTEQDNKKLKLLDVVSNDDNAFWLIDYWCDKNVQGLIQMPFSRHWIMHIEASIRINNKIYKS